MTDRDRELDQILEPFQKLEPGEFRLQRWKRALQNVHSQISRPPVFWTAVAASLILGFFAGRISSPVEQEIEPNATIEFRYSKSS